MGFRQRERYGPLRTVVLRGQEGTRLTPDTDPDPHGRAQSDVALMVRAAGGDVGAVAALYDRHTPLLFAIALRMLRERADAEDVVHEVWMQVHQRAGDFDAARGTVRAWLVVRLRSRALDRLRAHQRQRTVSIDAGAQDGRDGHVGSAVSSVPAPSTDPLAALEAERLRRVMISLGVEQRELLELAYFQDQSMDELATRFAVPAGTIKSRLYRAREALRDLLQDADQAETKPKARAVSA